MQEPRKMTYRPTIAYTEGLVAGSFGQGSADHLANTE